MIKTESKMFKEKSQLIFGMIWKTHIDLRVDVDVAVIWFELKKCNLFLEIKKRLQ